MESNVADTKKRQDQELSDTSDSSDSNKSTRDVPKNVQNRSGDLQKRKGRKKRERKERRKRADSDSDSSTDEIRSRHRSRERSHDKHSHSSRRKSSSRRRTRSRTPRKTSRAYGSSERREYARSRSRDRSRSHRKHSKDSHRSSCSQRSRSPRHRKHLHKVEDRTNIDAGGASSFFKFRSRSPQQHDRAMDAQERLARRLERAKELMKRKEELHNKEKMEQLRKVGKLSADDRVKEAVRRAAQLVTSATSLMPETTQNAISAQISAQVEALKAKALADTGIAVPSYYNPLAVNPISYAQQAAKRKKLWAKKDDEAIMKDTSVGTSASKNALWSGVKFGDDKSNEKFAKLMGIKVDNVDESATSKANEIIKRQAEVFQNLDLQYQQARITTHTQRGLGLGFSSSMIDPNAAQTSQSSSTF